MTEVEINLFARDAEYYGLFYLALFTGLRRSEILTLRWSDVDLLLFPLSNTK